MFFFRQRIKFLFLISKISFMDLYNVISGITRELQNPLPGKKHQYLMAPEIRMSAGKRSGKTKAAVLVCLFEGKNDLQTVFIKRTEYDGPHSGQISFPGGMWKATDNNLEETALRETMEETGIRSEHARILGSLSPLHIPFSNTTVYPFVAFYDHEPFFRIDEKEVSYLILANLRFFLDLRNRKKEKWLLAGKETEVPFFQLDNNKIWGATAMILSEFLAVISRSGTYPKVP